MNQQIYRKEALERMGSPEQLDQLMTVTSRRGWMALGAIGLLLLTALVWSLLGEVPTRVEGHGVLVRLGGVVSVPAPWAGTVASVSVQVGETIEQGQELARLLPPGVYDPGRATPLSSPLDGRILHIGAFQGDVVAERSPLLIIESPDRPLQAVVYVPAGDGYRVEVDDPVQIVPATAKKRSARHLPGRVRRAGKSTATQNHMLHSLQNPEWASGLLAAGPTLEITVKQDPDEENWPSHLYSGTPCQAQITVDTQPPIEFVLPFLGAGRGD